MGALPGLIGQTRQINLYDKSGTITSGGTSQLVMPISLQRSSLCIQNISGSNMWFEFGGARATATLTSGSVTSCTITNAGFKYTKPPLVVFVGGGNTANNLANGAFLGGNLPDYPSPGNYAQGHCVMTGSAGNLSVSSITIDNPGSGYAIAPYVFLVNDPLDPYGCADPFYNSVQSGYQLLPGGSISYDASVCPTDQIAVYCATGTAGFTVKFTT